jgi:glycosyltransferase involved in cell wall biosynthesis
LTDVAAVLLSLGEPTTECALASIREQTLPASEVVVVDGVTPFHKALNDGAARVESPYFVQVDADMTLEPDCFETLRRAMGPDTAIAVGALDDPLVGRVAGVKMFRRSVFADGGLRDTPAPEVDFYMSLARAGWHTRWVVERPILGLHRPPYDAAYVFGTYFMLGARYVHRGDEAALAWRLGRLRRSPHPMAPAARIALGHGTFARVSGDEPKPCPSPADARFLDALVDGPEGSVAARELRALLRLRPPRLAQGFREYGAHLRAEDPGRVRGGLRLLGEIDHGHSLLGEVAFGHGAMAA